jgi:hypothetical protein
MALSTLEVAIITGSISSALSGAITVVTGTILSRRTRSNARDDRAVDAIEDGLNAVTRKIEADHYRIDEADRDQLMRVLRENVERLTAKKLRLRLQDVIAVLHWAFVVAPDEHIWPAFHVIEAELRPLLGAYLRGDRLPRATEQFFELRRSAAQVEGSIDNVTEDQLNRAREELAEVFGDDWEDHADELLYPRRREPTVGPG